MKIVITGGNGFVGKNLQEVVKNNPDGNEWVFAKRGIYEHSFGGETALPMFLDFQSEESVDRYFDLIRPDVVVHLAAKVGGVKANKDQNFRFMMENLEINRSILEVIHSNLEYPTQYYYKIKHFIPILSTCIYPEKALLPKRDTSNDPLEGSEIDWGMSHESNNGYAYAKKLLYLGTKMLRETYGLKSVCLVPNNLFGKYDNFDLETSHVLPALIRKSADTKDGTFDVWGKKNVAVSRNFTYAEDFAKIIYWAVKHQIDQEVPLIVGNSREFLLSQIVGWLEEINRVKAVWNGEITYQGQKKKPIDNSMFQRLHEETENKKFIYSDIRDTLALTNEWYKENSRNI